MSKPYDDEPSREGKAKSAVLSAVWASVAALFTWAAVAWSPPQNALIGCVIIVAFSGWVSCLYASNVLPWRYARRMNRWRLWPPVNEAFADDQDDHYFISVTPHYVPSRLARPDFEDEWGQRFEGLRPLGHGLGVLASRVFHKPWTVTIERVDGCTYRPLLREEWPTGKGADARREEIVRNWEDYKSLPFMDDETQGSAMRSQRVRASGSSSVCPNCGRGFQKGKKASVDLYHMSGDCIR